MCSLRLPAVGPACTQTLTGVRKMGVNVCTTGVEEARPSDENCAKNQTISSSDVLLTLSDPLLRSASFALEDRWLLWARLRVYSNRLVLTGWSLAGRHHRELSLDQIETIAGDDECLRLELESGEQVTLLVDGAAGWAGFLQAQRKVHGDL